MQAQELKLVFERFDCYEKAISNKLAQNVVKMARTTKRFRDWQKLI